MEFTVSRNLLRTSFIFLALSLVYLPALAIQPELEGTAPSPVHRTDPRFSVAPTLELIPQSSLKANALFDLQGFFNSHSNAWEVRWDRRNDRPNLIQGVGVPILPGTANSLDKTTVVRRTVPTLEEVSERLLQFLAEQPEVLRVGHLDLRLNPERSTSFGDDAFFWHVEFQQVHQGVPVEGAYVYFRINHGNLVQFGAHRIAEIEIDTSPRLSHTDALQQVQETAGLAHKEVSNDADHGGLRIYPMRGNGEQTGQKFVGSPGLGYDHLLVWELHYRANDRPYKAVIDAATGEVLELEDLLVFAGDSFGSGLISGSKKESGTVTGEVYLENNAGDLVQVPLPFLKVTTNNGEQTTNANGVYPYPGGNATASLLGLRADISDDCGFSSLSSTDGNLAFGGATHSNCDTPGVGGAGNTNAARTAYYHLSQIHTKAASFLPGNAWLNQPVLANVNSTVGEFLETHCNATWDGMQVTFFPEGSNCSNTGEMAAVIYHEWGHGIDQNAGGVPSERGSGEALGDTFAFLETGDPCIGTNFTTTSCHNCRSSCKGVRDLHAFASNGNSFVARPDAIENDTGINCDRFLKDDGSVNCPFQIGGDGPAYQGPMGYQGHCESLIASTANWDLSLALQAAHGTTEGLQRMNEIWYASLIPAGSAYSVETGGQCNPNATVSGCGQDNWYTLYLAVDDDDGNINNGTPNGCRIWDAFNAHGIACGNRPACSDVNQPPVASFTVSCNYLACTFDASSSSDDDQIVLYSWNFGNGTFGHGTQPLLTYANAGIYTVTLTVTDSDGATDSTSLVVPANSPPPVCEVTSFGVQSFTDGLPVVSWTTDCQEADQISVQVKTTTLSLVPTECELEGDIWDGNRSGSRTADYMAGGYGPSSSCPAVEQAQFWVELRDSTDELIDSVAPQMVTYNPPPLPCQLTSFSVSNQAGLLPVVSWSTTCLESHQVSVEVRTTTLSQNLPMDCRLDNALWDGHKNGSRTVDFMLGGYGNNCPSVGAASFWVELWDNTQLLQRSNYSTATYSP